MKYHYKSMDAKSSTKWKSLQRQAACRLHSADFAKSWQVKFARRGEQLSRDSGSDGGGGGRGGDCSRGGRKIRSTLKSLLSLSLRTNERTKRDQGAVLSCRSIINVVEN